MAVYPVETFGGVRTGNAITVSGGKFDATISFSGAVATMQLQRSFDNFTTFSVMRQISNTDTPAPLDVLAEVAFPCQVRWACTAWTSGTVTTRLVT